MNISKLFALPYYYLKSKTYPKLTGEYIEHCFKYPYKYGGRTSLTAAETNKFLAEKIKSGEPFMAGRYGSSELFMTIADDFRLQNKYDRYFSILCNNAGFFPQKKELGHEFAELMKNSSYECDLFASWYNMFEEYYMRHHMSPKMQATFLFCLEPWSYIEQPWTWALKGKKVLVIHPFVDTITSQYKHKDEIWGSHEILPDFELKTIKAVQTIAGESDTRFTTWFEALDWMTNEALKIDFDVAIIGCGAYGFPLAANLKKAGKQAIHLGGVTQILFGIKGKRWEEDEAFQYVRKYFNNYWVKPGSNDVPQHASSIEGGCYW